MGRSWSRPTGATWSTPSTSRNGTRPWRGRGLRAPGRWWGPAGTSCSGPSRWSRLRPTGSTWSRPASTSSGGDRACGSRPSRGRPGRTDGASTAAVARDDLPALDALARTYDQTVPDPDAAARLRSLADWAGPIVGYLGKLIPEKGVDRELLAALVAALDRGDVDAYARLRDGSRLSLELEPDEVRGARGFADRVTFTGRLDHRYAPEVVAAFDVLVVPSIVKEAFGMVAAEGAAAGALPLVARHSSLAEVAEALEVAIDRPGALSFEPGQGATGRLADALRRLLDLPADERLRLAAAARGHVASEWTWKRTAERLLEAGQTSPTKPDR